MSAFAIAWLLAMGFIFSGGPETTVVLLPDEDGKVGAVIVSTQAGTQTLEQAYHYVSATSRSARPSDVKDMGEARVNAEFRNLLQAQPLKPVSFTLYFDNGTTDLTAESRASIPRVLEAVKQRAPTLISVIGHTDATGSAEANAVLSLERARAVEQLLRREEPALGEIELQNYGENDPLVPTPPDTAEPRNRRVEIMIL